MGFLVRRALKADIPGIARVHVDTWRTTYHGIVDQAFLDSLSYDRSERSWEASVTSLQSPTSVFVAVEENEPGRIVGFASCGPVRENRDYDGELYAIYILQNAQGQGIGRRLVSSVVDDLTSRGFSSMLLWVLADNPSRGFYEHLGGEHVLTKEVNIAGIPLKEYGYGWRTLRSLAEQNLRLRQD